MPAVFARLRSRRPLLAPEVIQTSQMDCGPAALKCLLDGHGIPVSYGRLREACHTDVDGTSVDTLEELANQLGLDAEQIMIPTDHVLSNEADVLPAVLAIMQPEGATHFVVVWRRHGRRLQIMDPAVGRRWVNADELLGQVYVHRHTVAALDWLEWARTDEFQRPLLGRLKHLGVARDAAEWVDAASADWHRLAQLDAAARLVEKLAGAGGIPRGRPAAAILQSLLAPSDRSFQSRIHDALIPQAFWSALPFQATNGVPLSDESVQLQGAVLIRVRSHSRRKQVSTQPLSRELLAATTERPDQMLRYVVGALWRDGGLSVALLLAGVIVASIGVVIEATLFRAIMDVSSELRLREQRIYAVGYFAMFAAIMLMLEWKIQGGMLRCGRAMELTLRLKFLQKLPKLGFRYLHSRPMSDMAQRSHSLHNLRHCPWLYGQLARTAMSLVATAAALCWLFPAGTLWVVLVCVALVLLPFTFRRQLLERDLRARTHTGAFSRHYLDALAGLLAIRAHSAERIVRRQHEEQVAEWGRASLAFVRSLVGLQACVAVAGFGLAISLVGLHLRQSETPAGSLLLAYWALQLPILADQFALLVAQYPLHRHLALRAMEPLGAPEDEHLGGTDARPLTNGDAACSAGVHLSLEAVDVSVSGHSILKNIDLRVESGSHVAIVGESGSGKSSLVGLLLGWNRPTSGTIEVDRQPLCADVLDRLRLQTAWVDPTVQLWNRSLIENLRYGNDESLTENVRAVLSASELYEMLPRLENGLLTPLGDGGRLLSGGEAQCVRFARALARQCARLVIMDEAFRGLERQQRHVLMRRARAWWNDATFLFVTHDIDITREFPRVLVMDRGRIVEDGAPSELIKRPDSKYLALMNAHEAAWQEFFTDPRWRRLQLANGRLREKKRDGNG